MNLSEFELVNTSEVSECEVNHEFRLQSYAFFLCCISALYSLLLYFSSSFLWLLFCGFLKSNNNKKIIRLVVSSSVNRLGLFYAAVMMRPPSKWSASDVMSSLKYLHVMTRNYLFTYIKNIQIMFGFRCKVFIFARFNLLPLTRRDLGDTCNSHVTENSSSHPSIHSSIVFIFDVSDCRMVTTSHV